MSEENSLVIFTRASQMLAEADTIQKAKELKDLALTAADWAKRKGMGEEAIHHCRSYALRAEIKLGEMLAKTERAKGGQPYQKKSTSNIDEEVEPTLKELGLSWRESSEAQMLAGASVDEQEAMIEEKISMADIKREIKRKSLTLKLEAIETKKAKAIEGIYDVIVIDPPWPMEKIERDLRPNQVKFDYPTMDEEQISSLKIPAAQNCHIWLWTTHKFLPMALRIIEKWKLKYICAFTWHKPGGFQPFGLPQYNSEFAIYARSGNPEFIDTKSFSTCFNAPRGSHGEKPSEFYSTISRVTAGRRLDMFARRKIEGFDGWGKEADGI